MLLPCGKCAYYKDLRCKKRINCAEVMDRWYMKDLIFLSSACSFFSAKKEHVISYEKFLELLRSKQQLELFSAMSEVSGAPRGNSQKA